MRTIFEAVRLIDGMAEAAREDVDVIVDGERITAIVDHGQARPRLTGTDGEVGGHRRPRAQAPSGTDRRPRPLHVRSDRGLDRQDRPSLGCRDRARRCRTRRARAPGRCHDRPGRRFHPKPRGRAARRDRRRSHPRGHGSWPGGLAYRHHRGHGHPVRDRGRWRARAALVAVLRRCRSATAPTSSRSSPRRRRC